MFERLKEIMIGRIEIPIWFVIILLIVFAANIIAQCYHIILELL